MNDMLEKIKISNFKQFDELSVEKISPITLIGGKNNTGKSSLLEAIFFSYSQPDDVFLRLNRTRRLLSQPLTPGELWEHYFYMRDADINRIKIFWMDDNKMFELLCGRSVSSDEQLTEEINLRNDSRPSDHMDSMAVIPRNYPISFHLEHNGFCEECTIRLLDDVRVNVQKKVHKSIQEQRRKWNVNFLNAHFSYGTMDVINAFGRIDLDNRKSEVIEAASVVDSRIVDISTIVTAGQTGRLYATIKQNGVEIQKIPLQSMGDGINRVLVMLITILATPNGIVLIDEIENGLHFSLHEMLWEMLIRAAASVHAQIIATTHSDVCLEGASCAIEKLKKQDDVSFGEEVFSYIRMTKKGSSIQAKIFDQEIYSHAMQRGIELR